MIYWLVATSVIENYIVIESAYRLCYANKTVGSITRLGIQI